MNTENFSDNIYGDSHTYNDEESPVVHSSEAGAYSAESASGPSSYSCCGREGDFGRSAGSPGAAPQQNGFDTSVWGQTHSGPAGQTWGQGAGAYAAPSQPDFGNNERDCENTAAAFSAWSNQPDHQPKPKKHRWVSAVIAAVCLSLAASGATAAFMGVYYHSRMERMAQAIEERLNAVEDEADQYRPSAPEVNAVPLEGMTPGQVYNRNAQAVVSIICTVNSSMGTMESSGSGFILSEDGYVVTNCHVVQGAQDVSVRDHTGNVYTAEVIGQDSANDIALLKVEAEDMQTVEIGSSTNLAIGDQVVAIGHPLGNESAVLTVGYVSAKDQVVYTDGTGMNMIQTDAAINSGNSGGPLFNSLGQVVGITTAKYSGTTSSGASIEGVGYAIPMDDILDMLDDLKQYGHVKSAYLGVYVKEVDAAVQEYGLPEGVFVQEPMENMAAEKGGILAKDVIVNVGGYDVKSISDLTRILRKFQAGDTVTVTVWRAGVTEYLSVTLDEKPAESPEQQPPETMPPSDWGDFWNPDFDFLP